MNPTMGSVVDLELTETMNGSLEYFFSCLRGGKDNLTSFLQHLTFLTDTARSNQTQLKQETLANVYNLASTIDIIASRLLNLEKRQELIRHELAQDLSTILNDDMENLVIRDEVPILTDRDSSPPYIKPCCQWLLANLHNPYPPKSIRNSICRQTGSSSKDLEAWFADARKRMGWNQLRRTHFSNKREKIIDAATSFFKPRSEFKINTSVEFQLSDLHDYSIAFVEMEECAQRLFSDKFNETPLARAIDEVAQKTHHLSETEKHEQLQNQPKIKRHHVNHPYPSPEHSPEPLSPSSMTAPNPSPSPIPTLDVTLKRRRSSSEASTPNEDLGQDRPQKRLRSVNYHEHHRVLAAASLPSPAASLDEVSSPGNEPTPVSSPTPASFPALLATSTHSTICKKRKRCLPDSEEQRPLKYPQHAPLSHHQTTPKLFPITNNEPSIEDLVQYYLQNAPLSQDALPSIFNEVLDDSAPVEVEYYQYPLSPVLPEIGLHPEFSLPEPIHFSTVPLDAITIPVLSELTPYVGGFQDHNLHGFLHLENPFSNAELDHVSLQSNHSLFPNIPDFNTLTIPASASTTFDWSGFANQPLDSYPASTVETVASLNDSHFVPSSGYQSAELERAIKRERAELLRAELQLLEADIA